MKTMCVADRLETYSTESVNTSDIIEELIEPVSKSKEDAERISEEIDELISKNSSIHSDDFKKIKGINKAMISSVMLALELGNRISLKQGNNSRITKPSELFNLVRPLGYERQEHLVVVAVSTSGHVLFNKTITIGLVDQTVAHPREVFSDAIKFFAKGIFLVHNHPSGTLTPSQEDLKITKRLSEAGKLLGIPVYDHLIVTSDGFYSMREHNDACWGVLCGA